MSYNESDRLSQASSSSSLRSRIARLGRDRLLKWIGVLAIALVAYWAVGRAWVEFGPQKSMLPPSRREMLPRIAADAVERIRAADIGLKDAVLIPFENDPSDEVTDAFRAGISESGVLLLEPPGLLEKGRRLAGLRNSNRLDVLEASSEARSVGVSVAVVGKVERLQSTDSGAEAKVRMLIVAASGSTLLDTQIEYLEGSSPFGEASDVLRTMAAPSRFLLWVLCVMLLPIVTFGVIRSTVAKRQNGPNVFLLGVYSAIGMGLAYLLVGMSVNTWSSAVVFLAALAVTVIYNLAVMRFALQLES